MGHRIAQANADSQAWSKYDRGHGKKIREDRGISQAELARSANLTTATLNRLEQEKVNATVKTVEKILDVFGLEIAFKKKE